MHISTRNRPSLWDDILFHLRSKWPEIERGWFSGLDLGAVSGGTIEIRARNRAQLEFLERYCLDAFTEAAEVATGQSASIVFLADHGAAHSRHGLRLDPGLVDSMLAHLRINHPEVVRSWFVGLQILEPVNGVLNVLAGSPAQLGYLSQQCHRAFIEAAQAVTGELVSVQFEVAQERSFRSDAPSIQRECAELTLMEDYTFENFVTGPCNRLAHAASIAVSESLGRAYNPLFLHGDVGLGKTHLLQAVCHAVRNKNHRVLYISSETFTNHFVEAIEQGAIHQFRYRYRHVDLLVIDDIQFFGERERSQEEFFHTFNTLYQAKRQIIVSADCCPADIPSFEERLISRFNSGLVASLDRPCFDTRMAIIQKKAKARGIEVPDDVVKYIASQFETNIRELEGALVMIDSLSQTRNGAIDLDIARDALGGIPSRTIVALHDIIELVGARYNVRISDLQSRQQNKIISFPRQICMYLARELTSHSLEEIGGFLGGRSHSTVLHGSRSISDMLTTDPQLAHDLAELKRVLTTGVPGRRRTLH